MDSSDASRLLILIILLLLSAFFSSAETCLTTVNKMRIKALVDEGNRRAQIVLRLTDNPTRLLSTILIGNNVVNLTASSLSTSFAISLASKLGFGKMESLWIGIATGILTILVLIFGEIVPKSLAASNSLTMALFYARPVYYVSLILSPLAFLMNLISGLFLKLFHVDPNSQPVITENELRTIVDVSHEEGVIESEERQMITNVVDFGDSLAKDVMVPKMDVQFVSIDASYDELMDCFAKEKFSRIPVYEESRDNIKGIIHIKDVFFYPGSHENFHIADHMREPYFTYEYKKISELFFDMKLDSIAMAIVLDEYGATAGLLTLEDLIEEIVGEIRDEYDADEEDEITRLDDDNYLLLGVAKLDDIREELGIDIQTEDYDSISGHIINLLDHFPESGEKVSDDFAEYTVVSAANNRIDKVQVHLLHHPEDEDPTSQE